MNQLIKIINKKSITWQEINNQFIKDLKLSGIDSKSFENIKTPEEFIKYFENFIKDLISYQAENFNRLMYRIDIPEKSFNEILNTSFEEVITQTCRLVLERESQKVYFRRLYKTK